MPDYGEHTYAVQRNRQDRLLSVVDRRRQDLQDTFSRFRKEHVAAVTDHVQLAVRNVSREVLSFGRTNHRIRISADNSRGSRNPTKVFGRIDSSQAVKHGPHDLNIMPAECVEHRFNRCIRD